MWGLVLTFSSFERNSHIGIAELVTRVVIQQPSKAQTVTFVIKIPLVVIVIVAFPLLYLFIFALPRRLSHTLHCFRTDAILTRVQPVSVCRDRCYDCQTTIKSDQRPLLHSTRQMTISSAAWRILSQNLVCRFVLCRVSAPDHAPLRGAVSGPPTLFCSHPGSHGCARQYGEQSPRGLSGATHILRTLGNHDDATQVCRKRKKASPR